MDKAPKPLLLFVDDSKVMRLAADKMLGGEFRVEVAENGLQAWRAGLVWPPGLRLWT